MLCECVNKRETVCVKKKGETGSKTTNIKTKEEKKMTVLLTVEARKGGPLIGKPCHDVFESKSQPLAALSSCACSSSSPTSLSTHTTPNDNTPQVFLVVLCVCHFMVAPRLVLCMALPMCLSVGRQRLLRFFSFSRRVRDSLSPHRNARSKSSASLTPFKTYARVMSSSRTLSCFVLLTPHCPHTHGTQDVEAASHEPGLLSSCSTPLPPIHRPSSFRPSTGSYATPP